LKGLIDWTLHWANTPYGPLALFVIAFAESSFFPVPPDILLITLGLIKPSFALYLAAITTIGSVLGGMFGYFIGIKGGKPILERLVKKEKILIVHNYFEKYEAWAIFIAGFTPIPYKVFTIAAGVFYIDFKRFVLASILGRGGRFFIVATLIMFFGDQIKSLISKYFNIFSIIFVVLLILGFYCLRHIPIKKSV
jgi:membrane protein YqaA with SNARE-associated domain